MLMIIINRLLEEYRKFLAVKLEKTLMAMLINQRDKGVNQKGRKSKDERNEKNSSSSKFDRNCHYCNRHDHKKNQCWIKHSELKLKKSRKNERTERLKYSLITTIMNIAIFKR